MNFDSRDSVFANTVSNENHESDINSSIQYTRWFLRIIGIWPLVMANKPGAVEKNFGKFLLPFSSISMILLMIPIITHVVILRRADRSEFINLLGPMVFQTSNVIKHFVMIVRSDSIRHCMKHIKADWRRVDDPIERDIMMRNLRIGQRLTIVCAAFMYSGGILYNVVMPLVSDNTINEFNETVRPLAFPGTDIFLDLRSRFNYEIVFYGNCVTTLFHFTISTASSGIAVFLVSHACGQIQIVVSRIEKLVASDDHPDDTISAQNRISLIIRNHVRSIEYGKTVEEVLSEMCLIEILAETLIICFVEYYCITEWRNSDRMAIITYLILLATFSLNLFLYCQIGEVFKEQFQEVAKAACTIEWYRLPGKTKLALIMVLNMGNRPRKLTAGKMMELSKISFASIMKTTFAYLNILRSVE